MENPRKRIAVIAPNILNVYSAQLVWAIQSEAFETDYDIVTYFSNSASKIGGSEYFYRKITAEKSVDAVIIISCGIDKAIISGFQDAKITPVLVDTRWRGINCVRSDNEKGAYEAAKHFLRIKSKKIGVIIGNIEQAETQQERMAGFNRGLKEANLQVSPENIWISENYTYQTGKDAFRFMVMSDIDAVFCAAGDYVAHGFLNEARKNGIEMPKTMSLIGFDDIESSIDIGLTTVKQPLYEMGKEALHMAIGSLKNNPPEAVDKVFECRLILRETA
jgi:LacI family transcriptional regulator